MGLRLIFLPNFPEATFNQVATFIPDSRVASGIDVGQGINVGPGKFGKKNKCRALNTHVICSK